MQSRRDLLFALVVAVIAATGCSPTQQTLQPTASIEPVATASAGPSGVALEPTIDCQTSVWIPPPNLGPITLTCANAVAAAKAVIGPDPLVTSDRRSRCLAVRRPA